MAWVAEILRKDHRVCARCRLGPTHIYDPPAPEPGAEDLESEAAGTPLCQGCLAERLEVDLGLFEGRALLFEPALGPEALVFRPLDAGQARGWPERHREAVRTAIASIGGGCARCGGRPHFAWVPVPPDAGLWEEECLEALAGGGLAPAEALCGACAARRVSAALEARGLFLDGIVPPRGGDGVLIGAAL